MLHRAWLAKARALDGGKHISRSVVYICEVVLYCSTSALAVCVWSRAKIYAAKHLCCLLRLYHMLFEAFLSSSVKHSRQFESAEVGSCRSVG
jgi:hypothetical protein